MKIKKPTTSDEAVKYDRAVGRELFHMLKRKMRVTLGGVTEDELFSVERAKEASKKGIWFDAHQKTLFEAKRALKSGEIPAVLALEPIIFNSSAAMESGVPYLAVTAISWLDTETPKTLPHALLSLIKRNK